jgi:O-antigen biosynthesis protein
MAGKITKRTTALVYGSHWDDLQIGTSTYITNHNAHGNYPTDVHMYCRPDDSNIDRDIAEVQPDIILTIGSNTKDFGRLLRKRTHPLIDLKWHHTVNGFSDLEAMATYIDERYGRFVRDENNMRLNSDTPLFSIFTGAYKTGRTMYKALESLQLQTYPYWEWVIILDSDDEETRKIAREIEEEDFRVRVFEMTPYSGGNIGDVKYRAASLSRGKYLVEFDHDDYLLSDLLESSLKAFKRHPDAGFLYSNCVEVDQYNQVRPYTNYWGRWTLGNYDEDGYGERVNGYQWAQGFMDWDANSGILTAVNAPITPKSIRFNIGMPNHVRMWERNLYHQIGGHNSNVPIMDDHEILIRTFLATRMIHLNKLGYVQYRSTQKAEDVAQGTNSQDLNAWDLNKKSRQIHEAYEQKIHDRIEELGYDDTEWHEGAWPTLHQNIFEKESANQILSYDVSDV